MADANDILDTNLDIVYFKKTGYLSRCSRFVGENVKLGLMINNQKKRKKRETTLMTASMTKSFP